jgi:diketogulonate reductase-like aldo/keto reductase
MLFADCSYDKTLAQLMIRWSVQKGYITIPKSSKKERVIENAQVFDWSIKDEDMKRLVSIISRRTNRRLSKET